MDNEQLIKTLEGYERYYDRMEREQYKKGKEESSDYAACMWCLCHKLKIRLMRDKGEDVFEILFEYKEHYDALVRIDDIKDSPDNKKRHQDSREACDVLEKRLRTAIKNSDKKTKA